MRSNAIEHTVFMRASGPPKRPINGVLGVKMWLDLCINYIGLKFGPLLIMDANFSPIGQLLYINKRIDLKKCPLVNHLCHNLGSLYIKSSEGRFVIVFETELYY